MKRLATVTALLALTACTPFQQARYWAAKALGGEAAVQAELAAAEYGEVKAAATEGRPCAEWYDTAIEVGWTPAQWQSPMARVMFGESRCNPDAYNRSGASGLMQVMPMWADDCGGVRADLFDPAFNLACALHVLDVSSWRAWDAY